MLHLSVQRHTLILDIAFHEDCSDASRDRVDQSPVESLLPSWPELRHQSCGATAALRRRPRSCSRPVSSLCSIDELITTHLVT